MRDLFGNETEPSPDASFEEDESYGGTAAERMEWRRLEAPCSVGVPVARAKETFTISGTPSVFDQVELLFSSKNDGKPRIHVSEQIHTVRADGEPVAPFSGVSMFTITAKMSCPSFSLPAGTPQTGGSCTAAGAKSFRKKGQVFTCDICYALKGRYPFPANSLGQATRLAFVTKLLSKDTSGSLLATRFIESIADFARGKYQVTSSTFGQRLVLELGVYDDRLGRICVTGKSGRQEQTFPLFPTRLPAEMGFPSTTELFESMSPKDGEVVGFFRIHDSGDFTIGSNAMSLAYLSAWEKVAKAYPKIFFWAPTRAWRFPIFAKEFARIAKETPNLVIRPSAFNLGDRAPEGVVAGTTVARKVQRHVFEKVPEYLCPVSLSELEDKSCLKAGCRACWVAKDLPVAYGVH